MAATTKVTVVIKCKWGPQARFSFHVDASIVDPANAVITGAITLLEAITRGKAIHIEISLSAATVASATSAVRWHGSARRVTYSRATAVPMGVAETAPRPVAAGVRRREGRR